MRILVFLAAIVAAPALGEAPLVDISLRAKDALFVSLDADRDGTISRREASRHAGVSRSFDGADADGDGKLSAAEFSRIALNRSDQPGPYRASIRA